MTSFYKSAVLGAAALMLMAAPVAHATDGASDVANAICAPTTTDILAAASTGDATPSDRASGFGLAAGAAQIGGCSGKTAADIKTAFDAWVAGKQGQPALIALYTYFQTWAAAGNATFVAGPQTTDRSSPSNAAFVPNTAASTSPSPAISPN